MKLPKDERFQFKVILRIFEKMFKKEMTRERVEKIISKIDTKIKEKLKGSNNNIEVGDVVRDVMNSWTEEIANIVKERK
jgi:transcriptional regulator NrdR family protein